MADKVYVSPLHVDILQVPLRNLQSSFAKQKKNESKCKFYLNIFFNLFIYISI